MNRRQGITGVVLVALGVACVLLAVLAPWRVALAGVACLFVFGILVVLLYLRKLLRAVYELSERSSADAARLGESVERQLAAVERDLPERVAVRSAVDLARLRASLAEARPDTTAR